ncbi:polysaccharide deacetylase family protein [Chloroflexota bacterium]
MNVPILMYHSIGFPDKRWANSHLTSPLNEFESQIKTLRSAGFASITLLDLFEYRIGNKEIPPQSIVLTFDDGYLDNWIYAYPILKKYGFKGTIFISPEFVAPSQETRTNLLSSRAESTEEKSKLMQLGFLSWAEMRIMEQEQVMDIQSHTMTHTFYPISPKVIDYRQSNGSGKSSKYVWMDWNKHVDSKYNYFEMNFAPPSQEPVYEFEEAITARRFFPESGQYETEEEYEERLRYEIIESKKIIEKELNKKVNFLCWPRGKYNEISLEIAKEAGYLSTAYGSRDIGKENTPQTDPSRFKRIWISGITYKGTKHRLSGTLMLLNIRFFNLFDKVVLRWRKKQT